MSPSVLVPMKPMNRIDGVPAAGSPRVRERNDGTVLDGRRGDGAGATGVMIDVMQPAAGRWTSTSMESANGAPQPMAMQCKARSLCGTDAQL